MSFNPRLDCLHYQTYQNILQSKSPKETKRGISSIIPSLYDPCGLIMPFLAEGKAILQKTWCYRNEKDISLDWDEELPPDIKLEFAKWMNLIPQISMTKHPRYLFEELQTPPEKNTLYLHVFCDAGETAFGIAAYIRYYLGDSTDSTYNTHKWMSKLIYSSSKVAPAKNKLSIPKKGAECNSFRQ